MFALKVVILLVAVVEVTSSPVPGGSQQPHSTTENTLPSEPNRGQHEQSTKTIHTKGKYDDVLKAPLHEIAKPHRLSKRFISPRWSYEFKRNSNSQGMNLGTTTWAMSDDHQPYNIGGNLDSPDKEEFLNLLLGLSKPKRHYGLLPAKELRRKDLPPRLGEESAPRFARTFILSDSAKEKRGPSARMALNELLHNRGLGYNTQPIDSGYTGRRLWGQTFNIDTPININNVDIDVGMDTDYSNYIDSDNSARDLKGDSEMIYDLQNEDEEDVPTSKNGIRDRFKNNLIKLISMLQGLTRY